MIIGKLYQIKKYYWLVYPSKETAAEAPASAGPHPDATGAAAARAAYWSKELNCNVTYIPENNIFCLLEQDEKFMKVLSSNGELGWMCYPKDQEWTKGCFEEVKE